MASWQWLVFAIKSIWGFSALYLMLIVLYATVPNTRVPMRAVMSGAFIAAILLALTKRLMGIYFDNAAILGTLYGKLGLIPLFMFWVYVMWMIILFGLEVAVAVHSVGDTRRMRALQRETEAGLVDPGAVVIALQVVADRFDSGHPATTRDIADATDLRESTVAHIADRLVESGFVHRLEGREDHLSLAMPPERLQADDALQLGFEMAESSGLVRRSAFLKRLQDAQKAVLDGLTLADVRLKPAEPVAGHSSRSG